MCIGTYIATHSTHGKQNSQNDKVLVCVSKWCRFVSYYLLHSVLLWQCYSYIFVFKYLYEIVLEYILRRHQMFMLFDIILTN